MINEQEIQEIANNINGRASVTIDNIIDTSGDNWALNGKIRMLGTHDISETELPCKAVKPLWKTFSETLEPFEIPSLLFDDTIVRMVSKSLVCLMNGCEQSERANWMRLAVGNLSERYAEQIWKEAKTDDASLKTVLFSGAKCNHAESDYKDAKILVDKFVYDDSSDDYFPHLGTYGRIRILDDTDLRNIGIDDENVRHTIMNMMILAYNWRISGIPAPSIKDVRNTDAYKQALVRAMLFATS